MDKDEDGKVTEEEFEKGLEMINCLLESPLSPSEISLMFHSLKDQNSSLLDYSHFLSFKVIDTKYE